VGEGVGEREGLQSVMYACFRSLSLKNTYNLDGVNVISALLELLDDRSIVERGRYPGHKVPLFLAAGVSRRVRERRFR
jgi:hypothetical protein